MSQNYKLTVKRSSGETATYRLEHIHSSGGDDEQEGLLADLIGQAMGETQAGWSKVEAELIVVHEDGSEREAM